MKEVTLICEIWSDDVRKDLGTLFSSQNLSGHCQQAISFKMHIWMLRFFFHKINYLAHLYRLEFLEEKVSSHLASRISHSHSSPFSFCGFSIGEKNYFSRHFSNRPFVYSPRKGVPSFNVVRRRYGHVE